MVIFFYKWDPPNWNGRSRQVRVVVGPQQQHQLNVDDYADGKKSLCVSASLEDWRTAKQAGGEGIKSAYFCKWNTSAMISTQCAVGAAACPILLHPRLVNEHSSTIINLGPLPGGIGNGWTNREKPQHSANDDDGQTDRCAQFQNSTATNQSKVVKMVEECGGGGGGGSSSSSTPPPSSSLPLATLMPTLGMMLHFPSHLTTITANWHTIPCFFDRWQAQMLNNFWTNSPERFKVDFDRPVPLKKCVIFVPWAWARKSFTIVG